MQTYHTKQLSLSQWLYSCHDSVTRVAMMPYANNPIVEGRSIQSASLGCFLFSYYTVIVCVVGCEDVFISQNFLLLILLNHLFLLSFILLSPLKFIYQIYSMMALNCTI